MDGTHGVLSPVILTALPMIGLGNSGCRHYFVKEGGRWVCTMCGASR